jgi:immune inhibitor A
MSSGEVAIGQSDPTPRGTLDSLWIDLPPQETNVDNLAGDGAGLHSILGNNLNSPLSKEFDFSSAISPTLVFSTYYIIEEDWDYTYILASTDDGATWDILLNEEGEYGTSDPNSTSTWLGIGGLTGMYSGMLTYDLTAYAGEASVWIQFAYMTDAAYQDPGIWIDDITVDDLNDMSNLYSTDLEDSSDWTNSGWEEVPYSISIPHYYMAEWRNGDGSIASQGHNYQYYSVAHTQTGFMVDNFPANVPGMLLWYRNNAYSNNQAVGGGRDLAPPAYGPKGELLVVDSHYDPVTWSGGWWNPAITNTAPSFSNRRGAMDALFTLDDTPAWMIHDYAQDFNPIMNFGGRPAVSAFHDSLRSTPGIVYAPGFPDADQDASVVIPAADDYSTYFRFLDGNNIGPDATPWWGFYLGPIPLGSGHPGDDWAQFGVHIEVVDQASDGSYGVIKFWNSLDETAATVDFDASVGNTRTAEQGVGLNNTNTAVYQFQNVGSPISDTLVIVEVPHNISYISGTVSSEWVPIGAADAGSPAAAAAYVTSMGYANLLAAPDPDDVQYFAFALEADWWMAGNWTPDLVYDYVATTLGTADSDFHVYHEGGTLLDGNNRLPHLSIGENVIYLPAIMNN